MTTSISGVGAAGAFRLAVELTLHPGEVAAVLGPNGAGKSTLLRTFAGLNPLSSGEVRLAGQLVDGESVFVPADERAVGLVFQNYRLFPHLSVRDNVAFPARARGATRASARAAAAPWVRQLNLDPLADRRPSQLSGGQAQRVAIARALAAEPDLLLLDEPLAALDQRTRAEVRSSLRSYLSAFPGPVLMVTHDPIDAMVLADRLIVIEGGRVVQDDTPAAVARRPHTQYVARLVGLNLYAGQHDPSTGVVTLDGGGRLTATVGDVPLRGPRVLLTVRPASISVHREHPHEASPRNVWPATVTGLEQLGDRVRLAATGDFPALVDLTPDAVAELGLHVGQAVWLSAKATEVLAYPDAPPG